MPPRRKANKSQVEAQVSRLAEFDPGADEQSQLQYENEKSYLESFRQQLTTDQAAFSFTETVDKHAWRKGILAALFIVTCLWLLFVASVVCLSATSPSLADRNILESFPKKALYCPVLFKLSDTVLVSFITSTTVSVLGLFMVAAKWLFPSSPDKPKAAKAD